MARGVLCSKCATVALATATACPVCGSILGQGEASPETQADTLDEEQPKTGTAPDATFTDGDNDGATLDADVNPTLQLAQGIQPKVEPSRGPVPSSSPPVVRRSGALAKHKAEVAAAAAALPVFRKDPMTGEKLGEYLVEEKLGTGGMGVVYKARQPQIGSTVAIKILRGDVIADKRDMERLLDEARVVNAIRHRGIIQIFGAGELDDGRQYLVMEYLDGETLEKRLERVNELSTAEALPILDEVLAALAAAHGSGIVHRDLKPANIFLVPQTDGPDLIKLIDFGLARRQMQEVSRIAGTPDYISPEHARGRPAGPPADLYGFGVLAFRLLTGRLPFLANSPMEMMEKHVHSSPPVPAELNPSIPPVMSGLILALLEKNPAKRPDAEQAKRDLKAAGRQLQTMELPSDSQTPKEGRPALTVDHSSQLDLRLKVLARKARLAKLFSVLARNWLWGLAVFGLLWVIGVGWMVLTPAAVPPAQTSIPIRKPLIPVAKPKTELTPEKVELPPSAPALDEVDETVPTALKQDSREASPQQAATLNQWRLKMKNDLATLDSRLTGELESLRPALNTLSADVEKVNNAQGQSSTAERFRVLKEKVDALAEKLDP